MVFRLLDFRSLNTEGVQNEQGQRAFPPAAQLSLVPNSLRRRQADWREQSFGCRSSP